jgi:hypothetical protein
LYISAYPDVAHSKNAPISGTQNLISVMFFPKLLLN